jgi:hypothetical protein
VSRFRRPDPHARFRQLLAEQLDLPLHLDDSWQLTVHLSRCEACRAVEREYREQRRALRQLPAPPVPRDLWARTSITLDAEMASYRPGRAIGRGGSGASIAASLAIFGAATLLLMSQWPLADQPAPTRQLPTPFAVPGHALAFFSTGPQGMSIYRTSVDHVCPVSAADCVNEARAPSSLALATMIEPSSLALSPSGRQLAITGRDQERDSLFAIVLMPEPEEAPARTPQPPLTPPVVPSGEPVLPQGSPIAALPSLDPTTAPGLVVLAILEDALGAGAPAAWSSDGLTLAFSAMPADGSAGPDLYVWRPGDEVASRLTNDGTTYFASWAGSRIVVSRMLGDPADAVPHPTTVVIDPRSGEQREIAGASLWLPRVNLAGSHAVAWHGALAWRGGVAAPDSGALYLVDWAALDPYADPPMPAEGEPGRPAPTDQPAAKPTPAESEPVASDEPTDEPLASDGAMPTVLLTLPPAEPIPGDGSSEPEPSTSPAAAATADPGSGAQLAPIEPGRDPSLKPVRDWDARWSPDGSLVALWVADVPGSSWGHLTVLTLDAETGSLAVDQPLLGPTLARRSFMLQSDRLAWVAPADESPDGELRVSTWGPDGFGVVRLQAPDVEGEIAPF